MLKQHNRHKSYHKIRNHRKSLMWQYHSCCNQRLLLPSDPDPDRPFVSSEQQPDGKLYEYQSSALCKER